MVNPEQSRNETNAQRNDIAKQNSEMINAEQSGNGTNELVNPEQSGNETNFQRNDIGDQVSEVNDNPTIDSMKRSAVSLNNDDDAESPSEHAKIDA